MSEADLYPAVKRHFEALGYSVYAEVPAPHGGYIDLLGLREQVTVAVELKTRFSREVVRQAGRNKRFVWESYVAIPGDAAVTARRKGALKRHGAGLLAVAGDGVRTELEARHAAPPVTVREAFGPHLEGELAGLYASATGGVPTSERVSAFLMLVAKVKAALEASDGIANTAQLLEATLPWNYFRGKASGLKWILENRFKKVDEDLWASSIRRKSRCYPLAITPVRTHLPDTWVCVPAPDFLPAPGDFLRLGDRRVRVISAERHPIVETPQREFRAGPAVFFPWRLPDLRLPADALVVRFKVQAGRSN